MRNVESGKVFGGCRRRFEVCVLAVVALALSMLSTSVSSQNLTATLSGVSFIEQPPSTTRNTATLTGSFDYSFIPGCGWELTRSSMVLNVPSLGLSVPVQPQRPTSCNNILITPFDDLFDYNSSSCSVNNNACTQAQVDLSTADPRNSPVSPGTYALASVQNHAGSAIDFANASIPIAVPPFRSGYFGQLVSGAIVVTPTAIGKALGAPCNTPGSQFCARPINIGTGNMFEQVIDYQTSGQNKLGFIRYYNSLSSAGVFAVSLGRNWRSNYDRYLHITSPSAVSAERADGQILDFTLSGGVWISDSDVDIKLTHTGAIWILTDSSDTVEAYTDLGNGEGLLNSLQARNGYTQALQYDANNRLVSVTDSFDRTLTFIYQGALLQSVTTPDSLILTYGFDSSGVTPGVLDRLISITYSTSPPTGQSYLYETTALPFALTGILDEDGNRYATWTYDASGRGTSSGLAGGADLTTIAYNDTDGSRAVTYPLGQQLVYKFATLQGVPKVVEVDRLAGASVPPATSTITYDANGYVASRTDWNSNLTTYVNDSRGQPSIITEAAGTPQQRQTAIAYLANFHLPSQVVAPGLTTTLAYDGTGELLTLTATDTIAGGMSRTFAYSWSNFLLASVQGPRTDVAELTRFDYDASGALIRATNALGQTTRITKHLPGGLPQTIVDPNRVVTRLAYDARQRLVSGTTRTTAGPLTAAFTYDGVGNLTGITLPDGSALADTYDAAHRLTQIADLFDQRIDFTLDPLGNPTETDVSDAGGGALVGAQNAVFDTLGRVLQSIGGAGQTTSYGYDGNGNVLTIADPLGRVTSQRFDAFNRLIQIADPAGGVTTIAYDPQDHPQGSRTPTATRPDTSMTVSGT
jgi:YD repeat-containing protein